VNTQSLTLLGALHKETLLGRNTKALLGRNRADRCVNGGIVNTDMVKTETIMMYTGMVVNTETMRTTIPAYTKGIPTVAEIRSLTGTGKHHTKISEPHLTRARRDFLGYLRTTKCRRSFPTSLRTKECIQTDRWRRLCLELLDQERHQQPLQIRGHILMHSTRT